MLFRGPEWPAVGRRARSYKIDAKLCRMKMDAVLTRRIGPFVLVERKVTIFQLS